MDLLGGVWGGGDHPPNELKSHVGGLWPMGVKNF